MAHGVYPTRIEKLPIGESLAHIMRSDNVWRLPLRIQMLLFLPVMVIGRVFDTSTQERRRRSSGLVVAFFGIAGRRLE
jgi:hypothetical protein